jgi:hypothetical protein
MGEQIAARESIYNNQAEGAYLEIDGNLPITILLFVCTVLLQITLYLFIMPLFAITGANLTLPLRQL